MQVVVLQLRNSELLTLTRPVAPASGLGGLFDNSRSLAPAPLWLNIALAPTPRNIG